MKKTSRAVALLLAGVMLTAPMSLTASAASVKRVKNLQAVSVDDDEIKLKWSRVSGASGYRIYIKSEGGKWRYAESTKKTSQEIDDLKEGTTYSLRVRAYKNTSKGKRFGTYSKIIRVSTEPDEVEKLKAGTLSGKKVKLSWKKVKNADGYAIYKKNKTTGKWKRIARTKKTNKTLSASAGDSFRVRAYTLVDKKYYYGEASDSVRVKKKASASSEKITAAKAKTIALKDAGVSKAYSYEIEKDKEDGVYVYEIEFKNGGYEYEYVIRISDGKILDKEKEFDD